MATILERVIEVVEKRLANGKPVTASTSFVDDLGADSLDLTELIMDLEDEFGTSGKSLDIPDEVALEIKNVQATVNYLKALGLED
ncbi:MAG: acyl carrier protein [bacterium]|nr:acyl carrier protein [bacterium]